MDGRLQDFRGDFAGAVSIGIVTGAGKRYQGEKKIQIYSSVWLFIK
jgi:hypothetical protein